MSRCASSRAGVAVVPDGEIDARSRDVLDRVVTRLGDSVDAVFARPPSLDVAGQAAADLDLLAFGSVVGLCPERLWVGADAAPVDLIRMPLASLDDPRGFGTDGVMGHRLLTSVLFHARDRGRFQDRWDAVRAAYDDPECRRQRISGFLEMGFLTVREVGVTRDFPALAFFWLHMAHAACLAAMLDASGILCPNVYTRPFEYVGRLRERTGLDLAGVFEENLDLSCTDLDDLIDRVVRLHDLVYDRCPEPEWPETMRVGTRYEYRYFRSRRELHWRIRAAREMARDGLLGAAVFYLRFWAYAVARVVCVRRRAREGVDVSFLRPARSVREDLESCAPEALGELGGALGGPRSIADVELALERLQSLRRITDDVLRSRDAEPCDAKPWRPYRPPPTT